MIKDSVFAALDHATLRRAERRRFLKLAGASGAAVGGLTLLSGCFGSDDDDEDPAPTPTPTPSPTATGVSTDVGILQLALNLEYLEAQFYSIAAFGRYLPDASLTGTIGTPGAITGGRKVGFTDPVIAAYAREIAGDEIAHVNVLRAALGTSAIAQPAINIDGGATGAFTAAARAAGLVGANETFDPYANEDNFLLAAFLFEDVGVTAYKGASPLITSKVYLEAAAGILAAEAYHAGLVRTVLYNRGMTARFAANAISNARDSLDGSRDLDQGITANTDGSGDANLVPTDGNGIAYSRSSEQVHNIVYLRTTAGVGGGFFPAGTNNSFPALRTSGAAS
ncbi:hypothetical protein ASG29_02860 [Sphingomonas sp. Leaf412]|uniref:ferritin-like domain-containing protein n=1 Tax=Sphingomonas sp. Leaf412 TaxID=1736370 RepID=UPI0007002729|nr:ferritin-like domain-containing protein [Sphingomonas sp. Leaf412]KQT35083.1 hypothetical protein ASG29_02860 [Sphingomonas sp. Leaf412]